MIVIKDPPTLPALFTSCWACTSSRCDRISSMIVFKDLPTPPATTTGYEANAHNISQVQSEKDIDAEHHLAAIMDGLGVTMKPDAMTADDSSSVLRSPGRGPGFDVSALSAAIRVPRKAAGGPPKVNPEGAKGVGNWIMNMVCGILPF